MKRKLLLTVPAGDFTRRKKFGHGLDDRIKDVVQELRDIISKEDNLLKILDLKAIIEALLEEKAESLTPEKRAKPNAR